MNDEWIFFIGEGTNQHAEHLFVIVIYLYLVNKTDTYIYLVNYKKDTYIFSKYIFIIFIFASRRTPVV
jgi:hypothetical protein